MRKFLITLASASGLLTTNVYAADKPAIGPVPAWVKPVAIPAASATPADAPISVLLSDQQLDLEPGQETVYADTVFKVQTPQGLAVGNISFAWRPDTDEPTVHKLLIHRGDQTIDVLGSGQTFTVVRREPNLESATLDGVLTANIQPEGLQVGDILEFALSIRSSDPVQKGHVEQLAGAWNGVTVERAHLRVQWPSGVELRFRQTGGLPPLIPARAPGGSAAEISVDHVQPIIAPKGAPLRYAVGRFVEITDYKSWGDVGALMAPLFAKAAVIPPQGPLRTEVEQIRSLSSDPARRAQAALELVQQRVRYVALVMGQGGLVPADAETTWSRRYGDCKAKTALLLALLHELGIQADPVAVNSVAGDGLDARLPMIGVFDHVMVRATVGSRVYWMDGAREGDTSLERLVTPNYGWGLPLVPTGAALVRMVPPPATTPTKTLSIRLDASGGILAPVPAKADLTLSGDAAQVMNLALANLAGDARDHALRDFWHEQYDFIDVKSASASFEPKTGEEHLTMDGLAHMDWSSGYYTTDGMEIGYRADFSRDPGPGQDAPFATDFPSYERTTETIVFPPGVRIADAAAMAASADFDQTIAAVEYHRHATVNGQTYVIEKTERTVAPEFPAKDGPVAEKTLRQLSEKTVAITKPGAYQTTAKDVQASMSTMPTTALGFIERAGGLLAQNRFDEAVADFTQAVALDPKNALALSGRGMALVGKGDYAQATRDLDAAAAIDPKNVFMLDARGLMAYREGEFVAAIAAFDAAISARPTDNFAIGNRANAEYQAQQFEAALRDSAAALKDNPKWIEMHLLRVNILKSQGRTEETLAEAATLAASPDNAYALVVAANTYAALGKTAEATQAYERALAIKPQTYIYLNRAANRPKSDVAGRRADLDAALALDPTSASAAEAKAHFLVEQGDANAAIATLSKALETSPADVDLVMDRGIAYAKAGDTAHADADFAAVRKQVTNPQGLNNVCWNKAVAGVALVSALSDCDASLAKSPDSAPTLDSRAFVLLRLGRLDEAIFGYDTALAKHPGQAASLYGRGVAWSRKGDKTHAEADFAAALKADPKVKDQFEGYGVRP